MPNSWIDALRKWNTEKGGPWCVPRKGSPEMAAVRAMMAGKAAPKAAEPEPVKKKVHKVLPKGYTALKEKVASKKIGRAILERVMEKRAAKKAAEAAKAAEKGDELRVPITRFYVSKGNPNKGGIISGWDEAVKVDRKESHLIPEELRGYEKDAKKVLLALFPKASSVSPKAISYFTNFIPMSEKGVRFYRKGKRVEAEPSDVDYDTPSSWWDDSEKLKRAGITALGRDGVYYS